jgi:DNA-binding MarR family transcriptional regulator
MPEKRISFLLNTVVREMNSQADSMLREQFGITYSQFVFLMITMEHPGIDVTRLASELGVTKGAVSKRLGWFAQRGLAVSSHLPGNSKRLVINLTHSGQALAERAGSFLEKTFLATISKSGNSDFARLALELIQIHETLLSRRINLANA